ncbi:MAG: hypothetical protein KAT68_01900 [Bacteroidales bacterium]|nr:hypothetical protein [Bacteroidales bacterium]
MNTNKLLILLIIIFINNFLFAQFNYFEIPTNTELSKFIKNQDKILILNSWEVGEIKGEDKINTTFHALEFSTYDKPNEIIKGIKVKIINTYSSASNISYITDDNAFSELNVYIDKKEYNNILIAINNLQKLLKNPANSENSNNYYITQDYFKFGFKQEGKKQTGFAEIFYDKAIIICKFSNPNKFFSNLKNIFDNASNETYKSEIEKKIKKGKKSSEDEKIIDTDI